jgi:hypothetical protein
MPPIIGIGIIPLIIGMFIGVCMAAFMVGSVLLSSPHLSSTAAIRVVMRPGDGGSVSPDVLLWYIGHGVAVSRRPADYCGGLSVKLAVVTAHRVALEQAYERDDSPNTASATDTRNDFSKDGGHA